MSHRKKKGGPSGSTSLSRGSSAVLSAAELEAREERHRDELLSLDAIFASDYRLISDAPGQPMHFQLTVKPMPNEADCDNYCTVLLDVMLTASSTPLLVVRKQKSLGDAQVEQLQQATNAEAERLLATGEDTIIFSVVTFMQEWLQPYNVAPKSFHEQMVERERRELAEQAAAEQQQQSATRAAQNQEKEILKKSIEAARRGKEEALARKQQAATAAASPSLTGSSRPTTPSSRSIVGSPASLAASPSMLSSSPPSMPHFALGASATTPASAASSSAVKKSSHHLLASPASAASTIATSATLGFKKSANVNVPEAKSKSLLGGSAKVPAPRRRDVSMRIQEKALDKKKSGRHKPRQLRECSRDGSGSGSGSDSEVDDSADESGSEDASDASQSDSDDEEDLFGSPSTSFDAKKKGGTLSTIDKLMAEIEAKEKLAEKQSSAKAASAAKKSLQKHNESDEESGSDLSDEDDEEEDDESEYSDASAEIDLSQSPALGPTGSAWLERNTSSNSSDLHSESTPAPPAVPALPYYSRFQADFEQLEMLGKGGFGEVYKVRNKVDKLFYAVKRIKLRKNNPVMNRKIVKEVSMIAMLHHRYIVRYYQAWIEGEESTTDESTSPDKKPSLPRKTTKTRTAKTSFNMHDDDEDWLSPSHPSTRAAHDDDDDDDDDSEEESDDDDSSMPRGTPAQSGQQYLYLQMEYCPSRTLRDFIDEKVFETNPEDCWRLFRQLLEAVAYVHSKNMLHRDLKPPNVLLSTGSALSSQDDAAVSQFNVRLCDFGLAVLSSSSPAVASEGASADGLAVPPQERSVSDLEATALSRQDSISECVGTHFYSAPEQSARGVNYDHRVDMYSIGIIFFEMVYPFGSLMERALQLEELRSTGRVPNEFLVGRPDRLNIIKIIESLLKHRPEDRPTAQQLLKSGLIPLKIEDEYMELALKSVSARDSAHHTRLLDILFSMPPDEHIDFTFDYLSVSSRAETQLTAYSSSNSSHQTLREAPLHFQQLVQMRVFDIVSTIFRNHGAIFLSVPIITPKSSIGTTKSNAATYLDPQGTIIKLPYTLTQPFARYIAQQSAWTWSGAASASASAPLDGSMDAYDFAAEGATDPDYHFDLRRYDISKVYRKNLISGRPKELYECGFDIVWTNPYANTSAGSGSGAGMVPSSSSSSLTHIKDSRVAAREKLCCLSAEVVKLTHEVLTEFVPAIGTSFIIKVNHADLFDAILDVVLLDATAATAPRSKTKPNEDVLGSSPPKSYGRVSAGTATMSIAALQAQREDQASLRRDLCKLASSYALFQGSWLKSPMRKQLMREKRLSTKKIDLLGALFQLRSEPGKPDTIFQKIRDTLFSIPEARHVLNENAIVEHLEFIRGVFGYLRLFHHIDAQVVFDISICGKHELYSGGIVFQALIQNTATDLGSNGAGSERPTPNEADSTSSSNSAFGSSHRSEPITQNAYETIALGGQYDNLIASFMPPTSSMPLSAVGVNFAIEKIVHSTIQYQMRTSKSISNATIARRIKKSLYGGDLHSSNILLFSSKNTMLKERVQLANDLWTDNLPCLYLHPPHLTHANLKLYTKEYMIRWLVLFKRNEFREKSHVQVVDLAARSTEKGSSAQDSVFMPVNEVCGFIRSRILGKQGSESLSASGSSVSHTAAFAGHAHSHQHSKPSFFCHIIDATNMKSSVKNQVLTHVKRCLNSVLATANPATFAVAAVDLPFALVRSLASAFYSGAHAVQTVIEDSHAKQRVLCDLLAAYMLKKCPGVPPSEAAHPTPATKATGKAAQAAALAAQTELKEKVEVLYIYSIPDRKADMILCS